MEERLRRQDEEMEEMKKSAEEEQGRKMAEAEVKLASTLSEEGGRERLNVENLEGGGQQVNPSNMISTIIR